MRVRSICLAAVVAALSVAAPSASAATFLVSNAGDQADADLDDHLCTISGGGCTLRAALQQADHDPGGKPHRIRFAIAVQGQTIDVGPVALPAITVPGTNIDGCSQAQEENTSATAPCVGLRSTTGDDTGLEVAFDTQPALPEDIVTVRGLAISGFDTGVLATGPGLFVRNSNFGLGLAGAPSGTMATGIELRSTGARIGGATAAERNVFAGNGVGVAILGADQSAVQGNWFGVDRAGETSSGTSNARAIQVTSTTLNGNLLDKATDNEIGGASGAALADGGCGAQCNLIAGSSVAGIDLAGTPAPAGAGDGPSSNTFIAGNWIGLDRFGEAARNAVGVRVGDADPWIGGSTDAYGNLISANEVAIDQLGGKGFLILTGNVFGLDPTRDVPLPNTETNATLGGSTGHEAFVQGNTFGATGVGLTLTGAAPDVIGNYFIPPSGTGSYTIAALKITPGARGARIGTNAAACFAGGCNFFTGTASHAPAIWISGADQVRVASNCMGLVNCLFMPPLAGPGIRITDQANEVTDGAQIGSDDPTLWNAVVRSSGPAVEVDGHATGVVVAGNEGLATGDFGSPSSLFTDLLSIGGLGNSDQTGQNGGIQPPAIGVATEAGMSGTGTPGAVVRVLQQWRADDPTDDIAEPYPEGYTLPMVPATAQVADDGSWSMAFTARVPRGQKLTASQTTAAGSSEYAAIRTATAAPDLPIARITDGPSGTVAETSATFSFSTTTPGATLECGLDGGDFAPCSSPMTIGPLAQGPHQFRVEARVGSLISLPVSRTWTIATPPPAQPATAPATTAALTFATVVTMPSSRRCVSRRRLRLRLRQPSGQRIVYAEVRVRGRATRTVSGARLSAPIDLRGLPKGSVKVRVRVVLSSGRVISGSRTYRTCAPRKQKRRS